MPAPEPFETVYFAHDTASAQTVAAFLRSHSIESTIPDEHASSMAWHLNTAIGGVRVQVRASQYETAMGLMADDDFAPEDDPEDEDFAAEQEQYSADAMAHRAWKTLWTSFILLPPFLCPLVVSRANEALRSETALSAQGRALAIKSRRLTLCRFS